MLKQKQNYSGYILLESVIAFTLLLFVILTLFPLVTTMVEKQRQFTSELEGWRYCYEMASEFEKTDRVTFGEKRCNNVKMTAGGQIVKDKLISLEVKADETTMEMRLLEIK